MTAAMVGAALEAEPMQEGTPPEPEPEPEEDPDAQAQLNILADLNFDDGGEAGAPSWEAGGARIELYQLVSRRN